MPDEDCETYQQQYRSGLMDGKGEIIIYQTPEGKTELEIKLEQETLWLN